MQPKVEYSGQIYLNLPKLLSNKDGFTFGQKLTQIEKTAKKRFYDMTDEEIFLSLKILIDNKDYHQDEKLSDADYKTFVNKLLDN
jgi:hypothetical protein